jgi:hypothetical protein
VIFALVCLITTAPLLIAVTTAVLARSAERRADARRIVELLRPRVRR